MPLHYPMSPPHFEDPPQSQDPILVASANRIKFWPGMIKSQGSPDLASGDPNLSTGVITKGILDLSLKEDDQRPPAAQ